MKYDTGVVNVTNGSNIITGVGTEFLANIAGGQLFTVAGSGISYDVAGVTDDTHFTTSAPYGGITQTGLGYTVCKSFTPNFNLPYAEPGDVQTVTIVKRAMTMIDDILMNVGTGGGAPVTPEQFGAVGDGTTDDTSAFQALAAYVAGSNSRKVVCGGGRYYLLNRYMNGVGAPVDDVWYQGVQGMDFNLNGSTIRVRGGFNRAVQATRTIMPFRMEDCVGCRIYGGTVLGSNSSITFSGGVAESDGNGFYLGACWRMLFENLSVEEFITDNFNLDVSNTVSNPRRINQQIQLNNIRSLYAGRQAISLVAAYNFSAKNSTFALTGQSSYGFHSPGSGTDIEPGRFTTDAAPNNVELDTGFILFDTCRYYMNLGMIFAATHGDYVKKGVRYYNCDMDVGPGNAASDFALAVDVPNCTIEKSDINLRDRTLYFGFGSLAGGHLLHNTIRGQATLLRSLYDIEIRVEGNTFISERAIASQDQYIRFTSPRGRFTRNSLFLPTSGWENGDPGGSDRTLACNFDGCREVAGNTYRTDLPAGQGGATRANFWNNYGGARYVKNEEYIGSAPGTNDTYQPGPGSHFDTTTLYEQ